MDHILAVSWQKVPLITELLTRSSKGDSLRSRARDLCTSTPVLRLFQRLQHHPPFRDTAVSEFVVSGSAVGLEGYSL